MRYFRLGVLAILAGGLSTACETGAPTDPLANPGEVVRDGLSNSVVEVATPNGEQLDQSQVLANTTGGTGGNYFGQQITAGVTGDLSRIEVLVTCAHYPLSPVLLIYPGHVAPFSDLPDPLYSEEVSIQVPNCWVSPFPGYDTWVSLPLSDPVPVSAGGKYTFVISGFGTQVNHPLSSSPDRYPGGGAFFAAHIPIPSYDHLFRTWVTVATNQPPLAAADSDPVEVDEGQTANNTGTVSDPDGDAVTLSASVGTVVNNGDGTWSWSFDTNDGDVESQTVTAVADDGNGGTASTSFYLTVNNVPPTVGDVTAPAAPVAISGQPVSASAPFSDPAGTRDQPYTCALDFGDGTGIHFWTLSGTTCAGNYTYADPGVYTVTVYVTDKDGGTGSNTSALPIVIYDPDGGFVTGGGWIYSEAGHYVPDPSAEGRATFGFVAKYKKDQDTPDGNTEFQFRAADMNFHSDSYEWLVVTGSNYAMFKGMGTINGGFCEDTGDLYRFRLWAGDDDSDTFRIRIWCENEETAVETTLYDNGFDQAIDGGSIVIHTK